MKTKAFLTFIFLLFTLSLLFGQVPQKFNYQAVARDDNGQVLKNEALTIKIGIVSENIDGTLQWEETHSVTTNDYGIFTVEIGVGTRTVGAVSEFADIDWSASTHFLNVQVNQTGSYVDMGTTQLLSVPYALNAASVTSLKNLSIMEETGNVSDSALFEVKNKDGNTVFAVYNEGVRVYVDDDAVKGPKGGGCSWRI